MTDEQIIKAADICRTGDCSGCPYHELYTASCLNKLTKDVYHLLNRQKTEIERLENQNTLLLKKKCKDINTARKIIKSEAIKEFAERLKRTSIGLEIGDDKKFKMTVVSTVAIDNIAKEMQENGVLK